MSSAGAVGSGGSGGAAVAPASSQRVTPSDGASAPGDENNKGVEMGGAPQEGSDGQSININITNEVSSFQNMSSEQSLQIGCGGSEMGQMGESNQMDMEKLMKLIMMMIMMKMIEKLMENMGGGAEGGASMMGG